MTDAPNSYEDFLEPQLNTRQLDILEELIEYLDLNFNWSNMVANTLLILLIHIFSGTDPDQDAESFIHLIEQKKNFALGDAPGDAGELANYIFWKKALFSYLLRGWAAEWYENNITKITTWENVRTNFITRFSDVRNNFRYKLEVEHCIRGDREEIWNFLHRIKRPVDKGWPIDMKSIEAAQQNAQRKA